MLCVEPNRGKRRAVFLDPGRILPERAEEGFEDKVATSVEGLEGLPRPIRVCVPGLGLVGRLSRPFRKHVCPEP